jgi:hypothetical protein
MSGPLPNDSQRPRHHQHEEEALQDNRNLLQIIPIDIDARQCTNHATSRDKQHPIPLPASPHHPKPLILSQMQFSMLVQVDQREHDADAKQRAKHDARLPPRADPVIWYVARRCIDEASVGEHGRLEVVEDEVAFCVVGERAVAVESVAELVEGGEVEGHAVDRGGGVVVARGERDELAQVEERHGARGGWLRPLAISVRSKEQLV